MPDRLLSSPAAARGVAAAAARLRPLALCGDPTELHRHRAHCSAARKPWHLLQTVAESIDTFLSPRFFSMLAVLGAGVGLAYWLSA